MCGRVLIPLLGERVGACPGLDPGVRGLPGTQPENHPSRSPLSTSTSPTSRPAPWSWLTRAEAAFASSRSEHTSPLTTHSSQLSPRPQRGPLPSDSPLHPLQGERQKPSAAFGEGSSSRPAPRFTVSKGRGRFGRLRPKSVRGPLPSGSPIHPRLGERQPPASPPECGEGSSSPRAAPASPSPRGEAEAVRAIR